MVMKGILTFLIFGLVFAGCEKPTPENALKLKKNIGHVNGGYTFLSVQTEGAWTIEVEYLGEQKDWLTISRTSGNGTLNSIILSFVKNEHPEDRSAVIYARFAGQVLSVTFRQRGLSSLKVGGEGTVLPQWEDYPGLKSEVLPGWMELPAVYEIEGCAWVHHDMTITGIYKGRNYSIFYDASLLVPRWVAYPLTPTLSGSGSRSESWNQWDPKIPKEFQPTTQSSWGLDGYHRGHMLPSADRVANEDANHQTFYPTNMTVQFGALNTGVWMNLETHVRSWSKQCDTLYVVSGAVPSGMYHVDRGGKSVNIPAGYYMALLKYSKNKSVREAYSGIAFYFDNDASQSTKISRESAMSISELEGRMGINFFINLPDEYVDYAEGSVRYSDWGL